MAGFVENEDFEVFPNFGENPQGGRPTKDYLLSMDMAKELSMLERNDRGKQARRYFIECEKKLRQVSKPAIDMSDPLVVARLFIEAEEARRAAVLEVTQTKLDLQLAGIKNDVLTDKVRFRRSRSTCWSTRLASMKVAT
jgi:anti-repressor protein